MPVLINGAPRGTKAFGNLSPDIKKKQFVCPADMVSASPADAFYNPIFALNLNGYQGSAIGWDSTTLTRVYALPLLWAIGPTSGTNGATPSASDTVPDSIDSVVKDGTATLVYSTTAPIVGTVSYVATANGSQKAMVVKGGFSAFDHQFIRCYYNKDTTPGVNQSVLKGYVTNTAGTQGLSVRMNTSRLLEIINSANAVVVTSTQPIPIGTDWHVLVDVTASTGVGKLNVWWTNGGDALLPDEVVPFTAGANAFGATMNTWTFGNCATNNVTGTLKFGGIAISYVDPGNYDGNEVSGNAVQSHNGKFVMKVTYPTGTSAAGVLFKIPAGTFPAGLKKMIKYWVYVPTGNPDVFMREYNTGAHGDPMTTKDAWVEISMVITTTSGDQYVGVIDGTLPSASHTSGQYFLISDQSNRDWYGLIQNPSFIENLNGWSNHYFTWDDSTITRQTTILGHDDDWAAKVVFPTPTAFGYSGINYVIPDDENLIVGNTYTFGIWVYVPTGNPDVSAQIPFVAQGPTISTKDAWVLATVTGVCTSKNQTFGVTNAVSSDYASGKFFYVDDSYLIDDGVVITNTGAGFLVLI